MTSLQETFDVAVVIPTTVRPSLEKAVHSVFEQDVNGRIQILLGVDKAEGNIKLLRELEGNCPENMAITIFDPGYSTSARHGGIYSNRFGGALRTILTYAANSRHVAYLDDDNWYAPHHLSDLLRAIQGHPCAFSLRWFVSKDSHETICEDNFLSVGPGKGIFKDKFGGFVDTNCLMLDKLKCHMVIPLWCIALLADGSGEDRRVFRVLNNNFSFQGTGRASVHYVLDQDRYPELVGVIEEQGFKIPRSK